MTALFTLIHPLVDGCSVSVLVAGGMTWERVVAYNAMAFALQLPVGVFMDEWPNFNRLGFFFGMGMTCAAAVLAAIGYGGWGILSMACIGNALFHLTAGKRILETSEGRAGPIGLFISTGALGLMAGQAWVTKAAAICLWFFAGLLAVFVALAAVLESCKRKHMNECIERMERGGKNASILVLCGLFALIAWRSWAGLFASGLSSRGCVLMMLVGAVSIFIGKVVGGYLADRIGCWKVVWASVFGSIALVFACDPSWAVPWLSLLFISQLATGPVLSLAYDRAGKRGGFAFGLNCLGLFTGSVA